MPRLLLIRHAQATYGGAAALSELGLRQAALLDEALARRDAPAGRIAVGTLPRQTDTARACTHSIMSAPLVDGRWDEYDAVDVLAHHGGITPGSGPRNSLGAPASLSARDFQIVLDQALAAWIEAGERSPCDENWPVFERRVLAALSDLATGLASGGQAWAFTSGGVIAAIGAALLGAPPATFIALNRVSVNSGVTTIITGRGGPRLLTFNDHSHLEQDRALVTFR